MTSAGRMTRSIRHANGAIASGPCSYRSNHCARIASTGAKSRSRWTSITKSRTTAIIGFNAIRTICNPSARRATREKREARRQRPTASASTQRPATWSIRVIRQTARPARAPNHFARSGDMMGLCVAVTRSKQLAFRNNGKARSQARRANRQPPARLAGNTRSEPRKLRCTW